MNDNEAIRNEHQLLSQFLDRQINLESKMSENLKDTATQYEKIEECAPPQICQEFQTARLFLSHFGFLNVKAKKNEETGICGLTALDPTVAGFCNHFENLDHIGSRTSYNATIFIYSMFKLDTKILRRLSPMWYGGRFEIFLRFKI